jgi:hypothetical protein
MTKPEPPKPEILTGETPCPFCGNNIELIYHWGTKQVVCQRCGVRGPVGTTTDEAKTKWRRRVY